VKELRVKSEIDFAGRESEYRKQYSVYYYLWMRETSEATDEVLGKVIDSNNINWAAEHVFKVNYREYRLALRDGVLYSPDFGNKTLLQMADDAILIREKAGANLERGEGEKQGVVELEKKLQKSEPGQVIVLMSPTDPNDPDMGGYSMIYVYEKQDRDQVRATAIRNNQFKLQDLQVLSNYLSGVSRWGEIDHLGFVANPFVVKGGFEDVVKECGINEKDVLPDWVEKMSNGIVSAMLYELGIGNIENVKQIFDAFQMSVKTRYEEEKKGKVEVDWIDPMRMFRDENMWMSVQRQFLLSGGREMMESGGSCGISDVGLKQDGWRNNNVMSDLMGINEKDESYSFDHEGKCVVCKVDPKKLGPCQICEECDQKIRAQVE
jgi:hypothetical protein